MSDLTNALNNYKTAFQKKLDAYQAIALEIPTLDSTAKKPAPEHPKSPAPKKEKEPIFEPLENVAQDTPSQTAPQKPQEPKQKTSSSKPQSQPLEPLPKVATPAPSFPEQSDIYSPPSPTPIIAPRHIIHRAIQSFSFRLSLGLILLLLL